jgi:hypothetical protein
MIRGKYIGQNNVIGNDAGSLGNNSFDGSMSHVHL